MSNPFFNTAARIAALAAEAETWTGTPFVPNAAVKGAGVSCQKLAGALLVSAGHLPGGFSFPDEPMGWGTAQKKSLVEKFMGEHPDKFAAIDGPAYLKAAPGDIVGILTGGCVHHCGVVLDAHGKFIHCVRLHGGSARHKELAGVMMSHLREPIFMRMVKRIWRPIE